MPPSSHGKMSKSGLGECIEDYEVHHLLGKGGFATVYKAKCKRTSIEVAIKMLDKKLIAANKMENRVREEVKIHSQLKHPSVLELYTFFEDKNYVYLVLELAHNGELHRFMTANQVTFTEDEASHILKQVVDGLKYLHSHYIIHRDMTLSNLLLSKDMRVKIGDFGLATKLSRPDETHQTMCGTPNYISPEVVLRSSHGMEVDVWGLGIQLYTLLVGQPPFETKAINSTLTRIIKSDYKIPHHISPEAKDLIQKLLKKNPAERIQLEDILDHPFMKHSTAMTQYQDEGGHQSESGIGTMTTGSKQESSQARIRCRSREKCDSMRGSSGLRQKVQGLLPEVMSPRYLPSRQTPALLCSVDDYGDTSTRGRRDHSPHESVRSGCSRRNHSHHSQPACDSGGGGGGECRTCRHDNDSQHSQCLDCRRMERLADGWPCGDCDCSRISRCLCSQEAKGCRQEPEKTDTILDSIVSNEKNFLPDHRDNASLRNSHNHTPASFDMSSHRQSNDHKSCDAPVNRFTDQAMDEKEMRNLDHLPLTVPPLCSDRLKPSRHKTKFSVLSILETGEVCFELLDRNRTKKEKVIEVCRISSDGLRVLIYSPKQGKGVPLTDTPPLVPARDDNEIYSYDSLPQRHHKKYVHAARYVRLVRAKTPKVTYYSELARCTLMENSPNHDFEVTFYSGGKIAKMEANDGAIKIIYPDGKSCDMDDRSVEYLPSAQQKMWNHFKQAHQHCLAVESALEQVSSPGSPCFPATVGSRPVITGVFKGKENTTTSPCMPSLGSYEGSASRANSREGSSRRSKSRTRTVDIPNVGIATQKQNGELKITYKDGTELSYDPLSGSVTYNDGVRLTRYRNPDGDVLAPVVRHKLSQLPIVLNHFRPQDTSSCQKLRSMR